MTFGGVVESRCMDGFSPGDFERMSEIRYVVPTWIRDVDSLEKAQGSCSRWLRMQYIEFVVLGLNWI